jgi:hypothetical protein
VKGPGWVPACRILQVKGEEDNYYYQQQKQGIKPFAKETA